MVIRALEEDPEHGRGRGEREPDGDAAAAACGVDHRGRVPIRAVVLEMPVPEMSGKATYLALRGIDPEVAIVLMSGYTLNEEVQEILDSGEKAFVSKPYTIAVLVDAIVQVSSPR